MIEVQNLSFAYHQDDVLKDISFHVGKGEIFGFLGPSGAGKSTMQKILIGLLPRYGGSATVIGQHCDRLKQPFFSLIGVDFETPTLYEKFTGRENLRFFSSLYARPCFDIEELLQRLDLTSAANMRVCAYSKGMKSRLGFARAILHNPDLLFLDEPTSGLDPTHADAMKDIILGLREQGKTILLTTHNMQDAAELCDRVAFLSGGVIRALGSPHSLIMQRGARTLSYTWSENGQEYKRQTALSQLSQDTALLNLIQQNRLLSLHTDEPTLADVFTEVTGGRLE